MDAQSVTRYGAGNLAGVWSAGSEKNSIATLARLIPRAAIPFKSAYALRAELVGNGAENGTPNTAVSGQRPSRQMPKLHMPSRSAAPDRSTVLSVATHQAGAPPQGKLTKPIDGGIKAQEATTLESLQQEAELFKDVVVEKSKTAEVLEEMVAHVKEQVSSHRKLTTQAVPAVEESNACPIAQEIRQEGLMPPHPQEGLAEDVEGLRIDEMVLADSVYNKELSWLAFNWRVLYMAMSGKVPLFERLRFLAICARNLDEFFGKRVGGLKRQAAAGLQNLIGARRDMKWTPDQQLKIVAREVQQMVAVQTHTLLSELLPALHEHGVRLLDYSELSGEQRQEVRAYFKRELELVLTPLAVDPGHPFPFIGNMSLSIAVLLQDPIDEQIDFAIVNVPSAQERFRRLQQGGDEAGSDQLNHFVALEQIIIANLSELLGGMIILSAHVFRVTRNADMDRNEDEAEDLLEMITDEVRSRKFAPYVRLEIDSEAPQEVVNRLVEELSLTKTDVYRIRGPLALEQLDSMPVKFGVDSELFFPPWSPLTHTRLVGAGIFEVIRKGDLLVHHPYHSFTTSTQAFVETAARDPKVVAIKATLYRTNNDSPVINALVLAAEAGKQVAVLVELKARFDEARNVGFAQKLENAGCNVAYGLVGLKTHCKATMVVRQEDDGLRTYVHIGTGNYNPRTAAVYTDLSMFSCNPYLGRDVMDLFKYLTGYHRQKAYMKLLVAPGTMRQEFVRLIDREIENAQAGKPAGIVVKCNSLDDAVMGAKLYEASNANVKIDCVVRGMCMIRPGVPGVSDNIRVISIIGRFLEHHRIFRFMNGGDPEYYIGSADWMTRNLTRRVEVVTPVEDEGLKKELEDIINASLYDRNGAWEMLPNGRYQLISVGEGEKIPLRYPVDANTSGLARRAEIIGFQGAMMEMVARQSRTAKKVNLKKKDGRVQRPRRVDAMWDQV